MDILKTKPRFTAAGILLWDMSQRKVYLHRRIGGYWDGYWALPGGTVEVGETLPEAAIREMREETGVIFGEANIKKSVILNCENYSNDFQFRSATYLVMQWENSPRVMEPNKASGDGWFPLNELPRPLMPHVEVGIYLLLDREVPPPYGLVHMNENEYHFVEPV